MASPERPIANVLGDIADNVREIVRSEVRLARHEVTGEIAKLIKVAPLMMAGAAAGVLAALFLCWTVFFALALAVPLWAASLVLTALLACVVGMAVAGAFVKLRGINPPEQTIASVKENVEWIKERTQ